jgi:pimeloyl-ACP methyl ester carboxylesterase
VGSRTKYAKNGDVYIAYETLGDGPIDLVWVEGSITNLDIHWEEPRFRRFCERLATFTRLITFDKRGMGLSDRVAVGTLEDRMDDIRAILDDVGSERAALLGVSEGGPLSIMFAASHPERTIGLLLYGAEVREEIDDDWAWGDMRREDLEEYLAAIPGRWGRVTNVERYNPTTANEAWLREWFARLPAQSISPGGYIAYYRVTFETDVRDILPTIRVPTLVMHRTEDKVLPVGNGRYIAAHIPDARYLEFAGPDHVPWLSREDDVLDAIQEFLTGSRGASEPERALATVLFTDIVGSTQEASRRGDRGWSDLLQRHYAIVDEEVRRGRGQVVDTTGDGMLASFDGPARAIRAADRIGDRLVPLDLHVRAGVHTGECEIVDGKPRGLAVHIGARVAALAGPDEILVSSTVKDLVSGSGIGLKSRGLHRLKGVDGRWRLYSVVEA